MTSPRTAKIIFFFRAWNGTSSMQAQNVDTTQMFNFLCLALVVCCLSQLFCPSCHLKMCDNGKYKPRKSRCLLCNHWDLKDQRKFKSWYLHSCGLNILFYAVHNLPLFVHHCCKILTTETWWAPTHKQQHLKLPWKWCSRRQCPIPAGAYSALSAQAAQSSPPLQSSTGFCIRQLGFETQSDFEKNKCCSRPWLSLLLLFLPRSCQGPIVILLGCYRALN